MPYTPFNLKPLSATPLSKSKYTHGRQCPLYLWLEVRTDLPQAEPDDAATARFEMGDQVGELARQRWDNRLIARGEQPGVRVPDDPRLHAQAVEETRAALGSGATVIHEAAFTHRGVKVRVDVLERLADGSFALHEVKSTTQYDPKKHLYDAAVQLWALRGEGLDVSRVTLTHLNKGYVWPGGEYDLERLIVEEDVTEPAEAVQDEVGGDIERLRAMVELDERPEIGPFPNCGRPYPCPYVAVCPALPDPVDHPITELPKGRPLAQRIEESTGLRSLLDLDSELADEHLRYKNGDAHQKWINTWRATVTGERIVLDSFRDWVASLQPPIYHFDFETVAPALPAFVGTHPYQVIPLQYSVHIELPGGGLEHREFIADPSDPDPRRTLIQHMVEDLGTAGSIIHWSAYEVYRIDDLLDDPSYAEYHQHLRAIRARLTDLGVAIDEGVFDPGFGGRWSLKAVYPALAAHNGYLDLDGVANGMDAALALMEYMSPGTDVSRRQQLRTALLAYCKQDTMAQVEVLAALR